MDAPSLASLVRLELLRFLADRRVRYLVTTLVVVFLCYLYYYPTHYLNIQNENGPYVFILYFETFFFSAVVWPFLLVAILVMVFHRETRAHTWSALYQGVGSRSKVLVSKLMAVLIAAAGVALVYTLLALVVVLVASKTNVYHNFAIHRLDYATYGIVFFTLVVSALPLVGALLLGYLLTRRVWVLVLTALGLVLLGTLTLFTGMIDGNPLAVFMRAPTNAIVAWNDPATPVGSAVLQLSVGFLVFVGLTLLALELEKRRIIS